MPPRQTSLTSALPRRGPRQILVVAALALMGTVQGCSAPGGAVVDNANDAPSATVADTDVITRAHRSLLIAEDFADAMRQIESLDPRATSILVTAPRNHFEQLLIASLQSVGYDLRWAANPAQGVLSHQVIAEQTDADGAGLYTFIVSSGDVDLKRSYRVGTGDIQPISSMFVRGASAAGIVLDSSRFTRPRGRSVTAVIEPQPIVPRPVTPVPVEPTPTRRDEPSVNRPREAATPLVSTNMYETGRSRFAEALASYDTVKRHVLVFANDSLVLGKENKRLVQQITQGFDADQDVLSVIGCSHGATAIKNGNEVLANGRANRVKEAFIRAGVSPEHVLAEGCWAGSHYDPMPARGVVVTHQRRRS